MSAIDKHNLSDGDLVYITNHVFLPPKLPQKDDNSIDRQQALLKAVSGSLKMFTADHKRLYGQNVEDMQRMLLRMSDIHSSNGFISEVELTKALANLPEHGGSLPLYISAQNAGVIVTRVEQGILFEIFELSPLNEPVLQCKGRLRRAFPGSAVTIKFADFAQADFQHTVAHTLAKMSRQPVPGMQPQSKKAGRMLDESRQTTSPCVVAEVFLGFLMAVGEPSECAVLHKNTREDVLWTDTKLPWRRSCFWLLIRVALQLASSRQTVHHKETHDLYKEFMLYFLADIMATASARSFSSDMLYVFNAKVDQRAMKYGLTDGNPIYQHVEKARVHIEKELSRRWLETQQFDSRDCSLAHLNSLNFDHDAVNAIPELDEYIKAISCRTQCTEMHPFEHPVGLAKLSHHALPRLAALLGQPQIYSTQVLHAFEDWVSASLTPWVSSHKSESDTCGLLKTLIQEYHAEASKRYAGNPEATSIMLLTVLELWVACDISATRICPLLSEYSPPLGIALFQSMLLPSKDQGKRLNGVETHLDLRRSSTSGRKLSSSLVFTVIDDPSSFGVRYYNQSTPHQQRLRQIETNANERKAQKLIEFHRKKSEYQRLTALADQRSCETHEVRTSLRYNTYRTKHSPWCLKCSYTAEAQKLSIDTEEWPLPTNSTKARSVVFESSVPLFLAAWRDATCYLMLNVLHHRYGDAVPPRTHYHLSGDPIALSGTVASQRISLLSEVKPHIVTHYSSTSISSATEDQVCPENGRNYKMYDILLARFNSDFITTANVAVACTYTLPKVSSPLQKFLFRSAGNPDGPAHNEVIASQSECPDHISLAEYEKLCSLPLGHRIQWMNILLQLEAPAVDFKKTETTLVFLQCLYQVGPKDKYGSVYRESHSILSDESFAIALMRSHKVALQRAKENWESSQALITLVAIARRVLSLTTERSVVDSCLTQLAAARQVTFGWVTHLRQMTSKTTFQHERADYLSRSVEVALVCFDTFNVDLVHFRSILTSPGETSVFFQCSMLIHDGEHAIASSSDPMFRLLHDRSRRFLHSMHAILRSERNALDHAITQWWQTYQPGTAWHALSDVRDHWLVSSTSASGHNSPLQVRYNLVSGELLVNGTPLNRLPSHYERHATYNRLFGNSSIEVMPSSVPGMQLTSKDDWSGHHLHFGMDQKLDLPDATPEMLVRAIKNGTTYDLIPPRLFQGRYPDHFVKDCIHWYNWQTGKVEFRSDGQPWVDESPNTWVLQKEDDETGWRLSRRGSTVLGLATEVSIAVSHVLSSLVNCGRLHTIFHQSHRVIELQLTGHGLSFDLEIGSSDMKSREYRGYAVDDNQSAGTLIGLRSKLLLKHVHSGKRLMLLLEGPTDHSVKGHHVDVIVHPDRAERVHAFHVDDTLGRLLDNGSLQSKLFLAYMHALTSACLPDPLTCNTGTEQALMILGSAGVRSHHQIPDRSLDTLSQIAKLSPEMEYYPRHLREMQRVGWSSRLGFLAQHGSFYRAVTSILSDIQRSSIFYPADDFKMPQLPHVEEHLLGRAAIRTAAFRVSGFGADEFRSDLDHTYASRDCGRDSGRVLRAYTISSSILRHRPVLNWKLPSDIRGHLWGKLSTVSEVLGPTQGFDTAQLIYDASLYQEGSLIEVLKHWVVIHKAFGDPHSISERRFSLMMWLSSLSAREKVDMAVLQTLMLMLSAHGLQDTHIQLPPVKGFYDLAEGYQPTRLSLSTAIQLHLLPIDSCPEGSMPQLESETGADWETRCETSFKANRQDALNRLVGGLWDQWPIHSPSIPDLSGTVDVRLYLDLNKAMSVTEARFRTWMTNLQFYRYLGSISDTLSYLPLVSTTPPPSMPGSGFPSMTRHARFVSKKYLFSGPAPEVLLAEPDLLESALIPRAACDATGLLLLRASVERLASSAATSSHGRHYINELRESVHSLEARTQGDLTLDETMVTRMKLTQYLNECTSRVEEIFQRLRSVVISKAQTRSGSSQMRWPRLSLGLFLSQFNRHNWPHLSSDWRMCFVQLGLAITDVQRAKRLVIARDADQRDDLVNELQNRGHQNWDPYNFPESLLIEVEGSLMIRPVQEEIAREMRHPPDQRNAVMQLHMGEGKSSVIAPILVPALAMPGTLVRLVVAKPQAKQMAQMLISRLGNLLDRRIYYMPFSRDLKLTGTQADTIRQILEECAATGGILLVQPEHLLSFKLMGLESCISGHDDLADSLLRTQRYFDATSRDIIDESDEIFSVKFELIYTMGSQQPVDMSPSRWRSIQQVLDLVRRYAPSVVDELPSSMELKYGSTGVFPKTRILTHRGEELLLQRIATHICEKGLPGFPIARQSHADRQAVFTYITKPRLTVEEVGRVLHSGNGIFWSPTTMQMLYLLRGLLAGGVLGFALGSKRWRVNYGLAPKREPPTRLAVPYKAKDNPTPRSEFSHPDVVIILTCLSVYYGGLENDDLFEILRTLSNSDQAEVEFQSWIVDAPTLPQAYRQISSINLRDRSACVSQIFPHLRFAKAAIDFYLGLMVFPKQMKEFPHKISASGWDIGKVKSMPTTGFSGTKDSQFVLPFDVSQLDLVHQKHTNALVLEYLLQPQNSVTLISPASDSEASDAERLLRLVLGLCPPAQVILDVGAQIIELSNIEVAREWLRMHNDNRAKELQAVEAAVFVDDDDELMVLKPEGSIEALQTSSYLDRLDLCLVYLDEAHTRGIDLRLPSHYRAAVTLGAGLTKDRMVQACMRMRRLGKGQSVVFCVPDDIRVKILESMAISTEDEVTVPAVIHWTISETLIDLKRSMPLWAKQGERYIQQHALWSEYLNTEEALMSRALGQNFLETESMSVEDRYAPLPGNARDSVASTSTSANLKLKCIMERCQGFGSIDDPGTNTLQEEQERELSPEFEIERQIQRPARAQAARPSLHQDIYHFLSTGLFVKGSNAYLPAFETLQSTTAADNEIVAQLLEGHKPLMVTTDFARTIVQQTDADRLDSWQRPVQYILTAISPARRIITNLLVVSPYEANELISTLHQAKNVFLQLYTPRCNLGYRSFSGLDFFAAQACPSGLDLSMIRSELMQLNIFAGQVYFDSFNEYVEVCRYLGLAADKTPEGWIVAADGFIMSDGPNTMSVGRVSPMKFLRTLVSTIRRNCEDNEKTHMGKILGSVLLERRDFE